MTGLHRYVSVMTHSEQTGEQLEFGAVWCRWSRHSATPGEVILGPVPIEVGQVAAMTCLDVEELLLARGFTVATPWESTALGMVAWLSPTQAALAPS